MRERNACVCMHTGMNTPISTRARTHTHMHARAHARTHARTHAHTHTHARTHAHRRTQTRTHAPARTPTTWQQGAAWWTIGGTAGAGSARAVHLAAVGRHGASKTTGRDPPHERLPRARRYRLQAHTSAGAAKRAATHARSRVCSHTAGLPHACMHACMHACSGGHCPAFTHARMSARKTGAHGYARPEHRPAQYGRAQPVAARQLVKADGPKRAMLWRAG